MDFINRLERRFGRYAIRNLMLYIVILNGVGMLLTMVYPQALLYLCWSMPAILKGQIWRIITFIFFPVDTNPLMFLIYAFLYYSIGQTLEKAWGAFKLNLYILMGYVGTVLAGIIVYYCFGYNMMTMSIDYICNSTFLAMALTFPDATFLFMMFIPMKAKWIALLSVVMYLYDIMQVVHSAGWMTAGLSTLIVIVVSLSNFIYFFYLTRKGGLKTHAQIKREVDFKKKMGQRTAAGKPIHKCAVCGRTDRDYPDLEFRYCSKCVGAYEYCNEHLYTHKHVTQETDKK